MYIYIFNTLEVQPPFLLGFIIIQKEPPFEMLVDFQSYILNILHFTGRFFRSKFESPEAGQRCWCEELVLATGFFRPRTGAEKVDGSCLTEVFHRVFFGGNGMGMFEIQSVFPTKQKSL